MKTMDRLYVDWDALKGAYSLGVSQAKAMIVKAYSKADNACRIGNDEYAGGVADGMAFAMTVLELVEKGMEEQNG